ncbi:MAG: 3-phosphoshikimate 1-carboxyvinyltransferase, partial [Salinivirgaceae bacterium]|nr:3-phosphoshikimate 1-carboxyvinyltransferase [Salinivirgaceae bacterium]
MIYSVKGVRVLGTIVAPASKSHAQRAIAIAGIAQGESVIYGCGNSRDVKASIDIVRSFGINVTEIGDQLIVRGGLKYPKSAIDCLESGLCLRMFSAISGTFSDPIILTGHGSLVNRSMRMVEQTLMALGVDCETNNGKLPIKIRGPFRQNVASVDGSESSQVVSGLLIAAPRNGKGLTLKVENLQSKSYVDLTIDTMRQFGVRVVNDNYSSFYVAPEEKYKATTVCVEGDWSGAAFLLVAGAIAGKVMVENISPYSSQPDKNILGVLMNVGANLSIGANSIEVTKNELRPFSFDATHCPDLIPPLVALAANCKGDSMITGANRLINKESDRGFALQQEFKKMGIEIVVSGDVIIVYGGKIKSALVDSHGDHRIAMACAVAGLTSGSAVDISNAEVIEKSYPGFYDDLRQLSVE